MELRLVNDNKLKITLTNEDMLSLKITYDEIDYDNTGTRRILWEILDKAKHETGFDAAGEKISVEVYPNKKSGGCMMYVIKKDGEENPAGGKTECRTATEYNSSGYGSYEKKYNKTKFYTAAKKKRLLYGFTNSEYLCGACKQLNLAGYGGKSDIFADSDTYYLYLEEHGENSTDRIGEYGYLINNPFFGFYLHEHSKKIVADDAVNIFCNIY